MLQECIESVLNQTYPVKEHLYEVDVHGEGPARIRNRLTDKATTDWIAFLDDDDLLRPEHFAIHSQYEDDFDVIFSWGEIIDASGWREVFTSGYQPETILGGRNTIPITATVRTGVFRAVGGFNENERFEDWYLWKTLIQHGARFMCIEATTWDYRTGHGTNRNDNE